MVMVTRVALTRMSVSGTTVVAMNSLFAPTPQDLETAVLALTTMLAMVTSAACLLSPVSMSLLTSTTNTVPSTSSARSPIRSSLASFVVTILAAGVATGAMPQESSLMLVSLNLLAVSMTTASQVFRDAMTTSSVLCPSHMTANTPMLLPTMQSLPTATVATTEAVFLMAVSQS